MDRAANLEHWDAWAQRYGGELRATTKCLTIKMLEIEALARWVDRLVPAARPLIVEVGCGNGVNAFALAERLPALRYVGLDFSEQMIDAAAERARELGDGAGSPASRLAFAVSDARELRLPLEPDTSRVHWVGNVLADTFPVREVDFAITDRMLINLASAEEQLCVMRRIARLVRSQGAYLMLENSVQTHRELNEIRGALGLAHREPAAFNVFIDEPQVIDPFRDEMRLVAVDDFAAIHDLVLYAVQPALIDGEVAYDTPLLRTLTDALLAAGDAGSGEGPGFGQNRLWVWQHR